MQIKNKDFLVFVLSVFFSVFLFLLTFFIFSRIGLNEDTSQLYFNSLMITTVCYCVPLVLSALSCRFAFFYFLSFVYSILIVLAGIKISSRIFYLPALIFIITVLFITGIRKRLVQGRIIEKLEIDELTEDINVIEGNLRKKAGAVSVISATCSKYAEMRKVIRDLSATLSFNDLKFQIIKTIQSYIKKVDVVLLFLNDSKNEKLSLVASDIVDSVKFPKVVKSGDIYDDWVLKNMQPLYVKDLASDVRFDVNQSNGKDFFKSLMVAPIVNQSKVIGTLRVNSKEVNAFSMDDYRVFNIIANISSVALGNSFLYKQTNELAIRDSLTGLFVHRYFRQRLKEEHKRFLISNAPLSFILADLDDFKKLNDAFGHTAGDIVLKSVSHIVSEAVASNGLVARYGGEEIAIVLPSTCLEDATRLAEKIRIAVEDKVYDFRSSKVSVSLSLGVAAIPENVLDVDELIDLADKRMYQAKKSGKNRVEAG